MAHPRDLLSVAVRTSATLWLVCSIISFAGLAGDEVRYSGFASGIAASLLGAFYFSTLLAPFWLFAGLVAAGIWWWFRRRPSRRG